MSQDEEAGRSPRASAASARKGARKLSQPGRAAEGIAGQLGVAAFSEAPWRPVLSDDEVAALEREITDDDLADPQDPKERARVANARRRLADHALLEQLIACEFSGPLFDVTVTEFAAYGIAIMMAWMRTGQIIRQCALKGRPLALGSFTPGQWSRDDRLELSLETTARALKNFIEDVLKPRKWDHRRGATLKTFFVGACLLQFPNNFDRWAGEQKRWTRVVAPELADPELTENGADQGCDFQWSDPTAEAALRRWKVQEALETIEDPKTRDAARLVYMNGYNHAEAGQAVGLSARAVEGRLRRLRRRSQ